MYRALMAVLVATAVFGGTFGALAMLFRANVRRFNRAVATDVLNDWATRWHAEAVPPPEVLVAMAALPAPGWRSSWNEAPVTRLTS